ncbi:hypothetical protein FIBSPDRAFT_848316 [Athelia psychrophila]|uniref:Uncharacterized protein n=1 Tax=Athelia psychrophila TaxID=1759441 RepID=A0A166V9Q3_9AGAM|nr:hypothetical protein FIBSPDRAFT_848316 [Fibularhizoctonia sp. CBS 109695]
MTETAYRRLARQDAPGYIVSTRLLTKITIPALVCGTGVFTIHAHPPTRPADQYGQTPRRLFDATAGAWPNPSANAHIHPPLCARIWDT